MAKSSEAQLEEFRFFEAVPNTSGGISSQISTIRTGAFNLFVQPDDVVALMGSAGWQGIVGPTTLFTTISRTVIASGFTTTETIYENRETTSTTDSLRMTSFAFVDSGFVTGSRVIYELTYFVVAGTATLIGPLTFHAEKINTNVAVTKKNK